MKLKTKPSSTGFPIIVGNASVTVNPLASSELNRLREVHSKIKRGVEKLNGAAMTAEMFDRVVLSWATLKDQDGKTVPGSGINDEDGNPLACTSENKRLIYEYNPDFVAEVLKEMDDKAGEQRLGLEGNLPPGPSGTSPKGK